MRGFQVIIHNGARIWTVCDIFIQPLMVPARIPVVSCHILCYFVIPRLLQLVDLFKTEKVLVRTWGSNDRTLTFYRTFDAFIVPAYFLVLACVAGEISRASAFVVVAKP